MRIIILGKFKAGICRVHNSYLCFFIDLDTEHQILFFFAIIGAFNELFLSIYFAFLVTHRNNANYYLSALLFAIGVKIITSVFLYFNSNLSETIVEIGFSTNALIGPLFYLYVKASKHDKKNTTKYRRLHIVPAAIATPLIGFLYPSTFSYADGVTQLSQYTVALIYFQWFCLYCSCSFCT